MRERADAFAAWRSGKASCVKVGEPHQHHHAKKVAIRRRAAQRIERLPFPYEHMPSSCNIWRFCILL
eukprot:1915147-Pleurochrysis_carterae.AAC.1